MALTFYRWVGLAAILCGVALVVLIREPAQSRRDNEDKVLREREQLAGRHVAQAWERLRLLQLLDSVRRTMPAPGVGGTTASRVMFGRGVPPEAVRAANVLLTTMAPARPATPRVPVDLVFLVDTAPSVSASPRFTLGTALRADYVLPDAGGDARRCLVIARVRVPRTPPGARASYSRLLVSAVRSRLLGPCGFYEWFGMPGPTVGAWLDARGWDIALASSWNSAYPAWTVRSYGYLGDFLGMWSPGMRLRMATTPAGYACATGDARVCDSLVVSAPGVHAGVLREARLWDGRVVSPAWGVDVGDWMSWIWYSNATQLGPRQSTLLAELARTAGPERFARFWTTRLPLRDALREATGSGAGEWTAGWAERAYGRPERGPSVALLPVLLAASLTAAGIAAALATSSRRQAS